MTQMDLTQIFRVAVIVYRDPWVAQAPLQCLFVSLWTDFQSPTRQCQQPE